MKAMILAAGVGKRMRPLTEHTAKPLLQVNGKPLIVHTINALANSGIAEIVINVYHHAQQIKDYLADGSSYGVEIRYSTEPELLGTGGGIKRALPLLGAEPFIVVSADIFIDFCFASLPVQPTGLAHLVMVANPDFNPQGDYVYTESLSRYGTLSLTGPSTTKLTYGNIGVLRPELFAGVQQQIFSIAEVFSTAISAGQVSAELFTGNWYNVGTVDILQEVNKKAAD